VILRPKSSHRQRSPSALPSGVIETWVRAPRGTPATKLMDQCSGGAGGPSHQLLQGKPLTKPGPGGRDLAPRSRHNAFQAFPTTLHRPGGPRWNTASPRNKGIKRPEGPRWSRTPISWPGERGGTGWIDPEAGRRAVNNANWTDGTEIPNAIATEVGPGLREFHQGPQAAN